MFHLQVPTEGQDNQFSIRNHFNLLTNRIFLKKDILDELRLLTQMSNWEALMVEKLSPPFFTPLSVVIGSFCVTQQRLYLCSCTTYPCQDLSWFWTTTLTQRLLGSITKYSGRGEIRIWLVEKYFYHMLSNPKIQYLIKILTVNNCQ